jgi:hypothetical protein
MSESACWHQLITGTVLQELAAAPGRQMSGKSLLFGHVTISAFGGVMSTASAHPLNNGMKTMSLQAFSRLSNAAISRYD